MISDDKIQEMKQPDLRDYFAVRAMQSLINKKSTFETLQILSEKSYAIADAMLKERKK